MYSVQALELTSGIQIKYYDEGNKKKPTLLFVHGLASYKGVWDWNLIYLKNHYRCVVVDLPGNGESSRGEYAYNINFFVEVLKEFMNALKLKKAIWVGHSMGGQICLKSALLYPNLVEKLILFAPASFEYYSPHDASLFKSAIILGDFLNMDEMHISNSIHSSFYQNNQISKKIIEDLHRFIQGNERKLYRLMMERCMNAMLDEQLFMELKHILAPSLIFFGENDMLIPNRFLHPSSTKAIAEKAVKEMPTAQLITYPQTGHFVQIEQASQVNFAMNAWLEANK